MILGRWYFIIVSIEWFIQNQAFFLLNDSASLSPTSPLPSATCLSFSVFLCVSGPAYCRERGKGGWRRRPIIQPREGQALYKSFNTHCFTTCRTMHICTLYHCSFNTFFTGNTKRKLHFYSKRRIAKQLCIFAAAFFFYLSAVERVLE